MITVHFSNRSQQVIKPTPAFYLGKNTRATKQELVEKVKDLTSSLKGDVYKISLLHNNEVIEIENSKNAPVALLTQEELIKNKEIKLAEKSLIKTLKKQLINPVFSIKLCMTKRGFEAVNI